MTRRIAAAALLALAIAWCSPAMAATWTESDITSLGGSLVPGDGHWLELPWTIVWELGPVVPGSPLDPRAVERLPNGNTLVASRDSAGVYEVDAAGRIVWSYTRTDDPALVPFHATRTPAGTTLIVDRWQRTVIEVDAARNVIWRYDDLIDPFQATRLSDGNTLIAENQAARVIEVRSSDYDPTAPDNGYTEASVVWQYGVTGELGSDHDYAEPYLTWPKYARRLSNGNTLIADETAHRVIEVTPAKNVVWSYGTPGVPGGGDGLLNEPNAAERLEDGTTLISDGKNNRVIRVTPEGDIVWQYGAEADLGLDDAGLLAPRRVVLTGTGSILIADEGNDRLIELGRQASGTGTSPPIDCGLPGARKRLQSLSVELDTPTGTRALVSYSIDGGAWKALQGSALPEGTYGTLIRYRVTLETDVLDATPRILSASIGYEAAPEQPAGDPGDDDGEGSGTGDDDSDGDETGGTPTGGGTTPRPNRPRASRPAPSVAPESDEKSAPQGYATGETLALSSTPLAPDALHRGWAMASVGDMDFTGARPGSAAPVTSPAGLLLLGAIYACGILSVPVGRQLARLVPVARSAA